jgi:hypothetical protein
MKDIRSSKDSVLRGVAIVAIAIGALAIGRLAIRRVVVETAKLKSLEIQDLSVTRLHAGEITVSDSLKLSEGTTPVRSL